MSSLVYERNWILLLNIIFLLSFLLNFSSFNGNFNDFLGLDKNFTISGTSFPINLQSGGTKEILICYKADSAGDYKQTLSIGDTCRSRTIADITFRAKADTKPPVIISSAADCGLPAIITINLKINTL